MPYFEEKLDRGEQAHRNCESMVAVKWMDQREVYMLSIIHNSQMIATAETDHKTGRQTMKPACVQSYNENKGAIDLVHMQFKFHRMY